MKRFHRVLRRLHAVLRALLWTTLFLSAAFALWLLYLAGLTVATVFRDAGPTPFLLAAGTLLLTVLLLWGIKALRRKSPPRSEIRAPRYDAGPRDGHGLRPGADDPARRSRRSPGAGAGEKESPALRGGQAQDGSGSGRR